MVSREDARKDIEAVVAKHDAFLHCARSVSDNVKNIINKLDRLPPDCVKKYTTDQPHFSKELPPAVIEIINKYASGQISMPEARGLLSERSLQYTAIVKELLFAAEKEIQEYRASQGV